MFTSYTLDQLTVFLAVVDEGSFSAAGRRVGRVQSAVSYAISQLETAFGTRLFDRSGRIPILTDAGVRLAAEARLVVAQTRELTEAATRLQAGIEPELRVAVDALFPRQQLAATCKTFQEHFPSTTLRVELGLLGSTVAAVSSGWADLGVCNLAAGVDSQLAVSHLGEVRLVPVCAADHPLAAEPGPVSAEVLERNTQIVHSEGWRAETSDQGVLASRTWRVSDLGLKARLIRGGAGWGSLPEEIVSRWLSDGSVVELEPDPWPPGGHRVALHAAIRREHPLGLAGQWFREQLTLP